jgi:hypothetical protein
VKFFTPWASVLVLVDAEVAGVAGGLLEALGEELPAALSDVTIMIRLAKICFCCSAVNAIDTHGRGQVCTRPFTDSC